MLRIERREIQRLLLLASLGLALWAWFEVRQHGIEGAFGGLLEGKLDPLVPAEHADADRPRDAIQRLYNRSAGRDRSLRE